MIGGQGGGLASALTDNLGRDSAILVSKVPFLTAMTHFFCWPRPHKDVAVETKPSSVHASVFDDVWNV